MKLKKTLSVLLVGILALSAFCYPLSTIAAEDYSYKIDKALAEKLETMDDDDEVPVSVWVEDIDHEAVKTQALAKIKGKVSEDVINIVRFENNFEKMEKLIEKEHRKSLKMQKRDSLDMQKFIEAKRRISAKLQQKKNYEIITTLFDYLPQLIYCCKFAPNVNLYLTKAQIYDIIKSSKVDELFYEDPNLSFFTEKTQEENSKSYDTSYFDVCGLSTTRDTYGLNGSGVKVGVYDSFFSYPDEVNFYGNNNVGGYMIHNNNHTSNPGEHGNSCSYIIGGCEKNTNGAVIYEGGAPSSTMYLCAGYSYKTAYEYLMEEGCDVINTSMSIYYSNTDYNQYSDISKWIDHISHQHNVHVVTSSGNNGSNGIYPNGMSYNSITVGKSNNSGDWSSPSSYCTTGQEYKPDLIAPGESIKTPGGYYSGTSFSAPLVTSAVAQFCQLSSVLRYNPCLMKAFILCSSKRNGYMKTNNIETLPNSSTPAVYRPAGFGVLSTTNMYAAYVSQNQHLNGYMNTNPTASFSRYISLNSNIDYQLRVVATWDKICTVSGSSHVNGTINELTLDRMFLNVVTPSGTTYKWYPNYDNKAIVSFKPTESGTYQFSVQRLNNTNGSLRTSIAFSLQEE